MVIFLSLVFLVLLVICKDIGSISVDVEKIMELLEKHE